MVSFYPLVNKFHLDNIVEQLKEYLGTQFQNTSNKKSLLATIAFVYLSYAGVTKIAAVAGEVKNPSRNLPLAMLTSLLIMTVIYSAVAFILTEYVSPESLKKDYRPIYTLAETLTNNNTYMGYSAAVIGILTLVSIQGDDIIDLSISLLSLSIKNFNEINPPRL